MPRASRIFISHLTYTILEPVYRPAMISICHQLPQRSFLWLWDPPLLCARCTGFYLAILAALTLIALRGRRASGWMPYAIGAGLAACAATGLEKFLGLELGNWGRFLTALPIGFAIGFGLATPYLFRKSQEAIS